MWCGVVCLFGAAKNRLLNEALQTASSERRRKSTRTDIQASVTDCQQQIQRQREFCGTMIQLIEEMRDMIGHEKHHSSSSIRKHSWKALRVQLRQG